MNFENMIPNAGKMTEMNQQFMTSMVKMGEIITESHSKLVGQQTLAMQANMTAFTKIVNAVGGSEKPADIYATQVEVAQSWSEEMMGMAKEALEVQVEARDKVAAVFTETASKAKPAGAKKAA
jgi:hypothetical protein